MKVTRLELYPNVTLVLAPIDLAMAKTTFAGVPHPVVARAAHILHGSAIQASIDT